MVPAESQLPAETTILRIILHADGYFTTPLQNFLEGLAKYLLKMPHYYYGSDTVIWMQYFESLLGTPGSDFSSLPDHA